MSASDDLFDRIKGPEVARAADPHVRTWVLLLLDAVTRNGLAPISKLRFHRLIYVTNCLSPVYGLRAGDERIVKFRRGPFYPVLQWHLDRLIGQGLGRISNVHFFTDAYGPWMEASYSLDRRGVGVIKRLCTLEHLSALAAFLMEVTKAYAVRRDDALDDVLLADLTYDDERHAMGAVIDFSRARDNLSAQAANAFSTLVKDPRFVSAEDRVHLYLEYIDRVWAKRRKVS